MTKTIALTALLAALAAPVAADSFHEMQAADVLADYGFSVDVDDLRLSQVVEIAKIEDAATQGQGPAAVRAQIDAALSRR